MVLVRIEQLGVPVYYVVPLLEMAAFGCPPAESLKLVLNSVFKVDQVDLQITAGNVLLIDYEKLVCATLDGANFNLLSTVDHLQEWLLIGHNLLKSIVQTTDWN